LTQRFANGEKPLTGQDISQILEIPIRLLRQILSELVQSGIVSEIKAADRNDPAYQPAFAIHRLTLARVVEALDERGIGSIPVVETEASVSLSAALEDFREAVQRSPANRLLKDV
jgi:membrane protein